MTVKDGIRKQIKKQNAPALTEEQIVGKIEREVKRKQGEEMKLLEKKICVLQNKLKLPLTPHAHWDR